MHETTIPGITAKHAVITDECRAAYSDGGAFNKAVMQLLAEYSLVTEFRKSEKGVNYHLVLTVEATKDKPPALLFGDGAVMPEPRGGHMSSGPGNS